MPSDNSTILLISNSRDFASDFVVAQLRERGSQYLRLDLDLLEKDHIQLDPVQQMLHVRGDLGESKLQASDIRSILFRAPTHLRESSGGRRPPDELLSRHQWAAFSRSLMIFDGPLWVNHPAATYQAENKPYQLMVAARIGFRVPRTIVSNCIPECSHPIWDEKTNAIALKALDSFLVRLESDEDAFFYTQRVGREELNDDSLRSMPVILQEYLGSSD